MDNDLKYTIEFYRSDFRQLDESLTDEQCDELMAALEAYIDECFSDWIAVMQYEKED